LPVLSSFEFMEIRVRIIIARLGLVVGSLLLVLLLLEGLLHLGAWFVRGDPQEANSLGSTSQLRILCVGDSNTYGMWLDRSLAYPARLEAIWNDSGRTPRIEALNLGHPGNNSSRLLQSLPEMLASLDPDWVIVMVGANDFWTEPVEIQALEARANVWAFLRRTRVYRLAYMIERSFEVEDVKVEAEEPVPGKFDWTARVGDREFELGHATSKPQNRKRATRELLRNLESAIALIQRHRARIILMTYPSWSGNYGASNQITRTVAKRTGIALVDQAQTFRKACPDAQCEKLLLRDQHPRAEGYVLAAETLVGPLAEEISR
jgi:lysophospholipase L1-like esterase